MNQRVPSTLRNIKPSYLCIAAFSILLVNGLGTEVEAADTHEIEAKPNSLLLAKEAIAIGGYDPLAYHLGDGAMKGNEEHAFVWNDQTWLFSSETNKDKFEAAPRAYAPQFEGCCTYALSEGKVLRGNPQVFRIFDDKLYFFLDEKKRALFEGDIYGDARHRTNSLLPAKDAIAIGGYDPLAYHLGIGATKGSEEHALVWNDQTWLFSSEANKDIFEAAPHDYVPQFDGCCAYGLSEGKVIRGDPQVFRIRDGKLYFFHNENMRTLFEEGNKQVLFDEDVAERLIKAEKSYFKIFSTKF